MHADMKRGKTFSI